MGKNRSCADGEDKNGTRWERTQVGEVGRGDPGEETRGRGRGAGIKRATQEWTQKAAKKNDDPLRVTSGDGRRGAEAGPCSAYLAEKDADLVAVGVTSE